ncbi:MAG: hypothetical protein AAGH15_23705 [Myxococcota bacterium]
MGFWADASPITKGAIVLGVIGIIVVIGLRVAGSGGPEGTTQQRGLLPPGSAAPR